MDADRFDALLRSLSTAPSRRSALRLLAGSALGSALAWLGSEETEAGKKKKKKKKGKKKKKRGCPEGWIDCGGSCVGPSECCPNEKRCGGGCILASGCCPYTERQCPDGTCVPTNTCCTGEPCGPCGVCVHGACVEVVGICDSGCERCNQVHWSCESTCSGGRPCADGQCCPSERFCSGICCPDGQRCNVYGNCEDHTKCPKEYCTRNNLTCCPPNNYTNTTYCIPTTCSCADTVVGYKC